MVFGNLIAMSDACPKRPLSFREPFPMIDFSVRPFLTVSNMAVKSCGLDAVFLYAALADKTEKNSGKSRCYQERYGNLSLLN